MSALEWIADKIRAGPDWLLVSVFFIFFGYLAWLLYKAYRGMQER